MKIEYRAWDTIDLEMISSKSIKELSIKDLNKKPFIAMQYTDTHDKNGKRVCESDIIHVLRQIVHVEEGYADSWRNGDEQHKKYLLDNKYVQIADYEEIGIVKKNPTRWALSPYVAKTVSFDNLQVTENWVQASKSRPLRVNRGLWIVEIIGNIYDTPELYTNAEKNT